MRKLSSLRPFKGKARVAAAVALISAAVVAGALVSTRHPAATVKADAPAGAALGANAASDPHAGPAHVGNGVMVGRDYHHDRSQALRDVKALPIKKVREPEGEAAENSSLGLPHKDKADPVVQRRVGAGSMPSPILNFDGIPYPGVTCQCAPPDTNGEVGATQYVQIVNTGYQVFDKATGNSLLGPLSIESVWSGFGGVCQTGGFGDPVVVYDQLANRWVVSEFAGAASTPTDECIAVSTTTDATGTYNRYGFHLGTNFFDYPKLSVWPDAYYMADNVFNASGTAFLGPQPFAFDRAAMLTGAAATFVTTGITGGATENPYLPADLDGSTLPPAGAPNTFVEWPGGGSYKVFHFHVDFAVPTNSTFTLFTSVPAAGFTQLCTTTRACVPQQGVSDKIDAIADRLMFRSAYRNFGDHEALVGNYTVSSGGVAGIRWFELRNVTNGPVSLFQESTYQPDTTWRWMGSVAMDKSGDMALGFSASSSAIHPQVRYTGRLATDPINQMAQGETTLFSGNGSQTATFNRWGDYSDMTIDPVDDCTFWYTQEYYSTTSQFNWRTRIGSFKFSQCGGQQALATQTKLQLRPNPVPQGGTLTFKALVKTQGGTVPVGSVSFTVDGNQVASATVDGTGTAQTTWVVNVGAGDHPARAIFTPTDPNAFLGSQSTNTRLTVT